VTYGIATSRLYETLDEFLTFALATGTGNVMLIWGTVVGGILAWPDLFLRRHLVAHAAGQERRHLRRDS